MPWRRIHLRLQSAVVGFFTWLSERAVRRPKGVLLLAALVTLATAPGMRWLKLRTDGEALVSQSAPEVLYDQSIRRQFGIDDQIVVMVHARNPDGIFNPETLQRVRDLTAALARLPGITASNVMSLATEPSFRLRPGTLVQETLLEPPPRTKAELDRLREDLRRIELYTGTLVSADGTSTAILVGVPAGADRTGLYHEVLEVETAQPGGADELAVTGAPVAESLLGIHILEDLGVPKALLRGRTRSRTETTAWKMPGNLYELRLLLARHVGLVPVAALVMMLMVFLSFRNVLATLLPLPGAAATLVFVFGFMGWWGIPIYLTIAVMPVLLVATGVTNDIYVFSRYFRLLREDPGADHVGLVGETFRAMVRPLTSSSLTTGIGFLSFGLSPLGPVRAFGFCTGLGVLFGLLYSFTAVPAMLVLLKPAWLVRRSAEGRGYGEEGPKGWFGTLGMAVVRWRWWVIGLVLVILALAPLGLRRLVVQDSWTDAFDPASDFYRATRRVNEQFYGMHLLFVSFDVPSLRRGEVPASAMSRDGIFLRRDWVTHAALVSGSAITLTVPGTRAGEGSNVPPLAVWHSHIEMAFDQGTNVIVRLPRPGTPTNFWDACASAGKVEFEVVIQSHVRPEIIRSIGELGSFIRERSRYAVGGVLSPADYLSTTRFMVRPNDPAARVLPDDPSEIKLMWNYYGLALGQRRLRQVVDTNYWRSLTTVFLKNANFVDTAALMRDLRAYERERLTPKGIKLGFAGDVAVSQSLIRGIVSTQVQSLVWSVVGIWLVTTVLGGSWRWGAYCVLPSLLAVLVKLSVMGWLGIPLGVATSMFAAMTLGIGVNCAIQLLESLRRAQAMGASPQDAPGLALALTGPPALVNTVAVSLGFGVLMLSQVPANARLGLLMVLSLVNCFIASLLLLPVLLHWWPLASTPARRPELVSR